MDKTEIQHSETLTVDENADETTLTDVENSESITTDTTSTEDTPSTETETLTVTENEEDADDDDVVKKIRKLNSENKSLRTRLRDTEELFTKIGSDPEGVKTLISERDTYKTNFDTLVASIKSERLTNSMTEVSRKNGAIEPSAVIALASTADVVVEYDENNAPTNVEAVVKNLKTKYPKLFGQISSNGNAGARNERDANTDALSPTQRMTLGFSETS